MGFYWDSLTFEEFCGGILSEFLKKCDVKLIEKFEKSVKCCNGA